MLVEKEIARLLRKAPGCLDFLKYTSYGLVVQNIESAEDDLVCNIFPAYCAIEANVISAEMLVAPLVFLGVCYQNNLSLKQKDEFLNELLWFFSYSKAKKTFPNATKDQLMSWKKISEIERFLPGLNSAENLSREDCLKRKLLIELGFDSQSKIPGFFDRLWEFAQNEDNFGEFVMKAEKLSGDTYTFDKKHFRKKSRPKSRIVVQQAFGRTYGVIATTNVPWTPSKEHLMDLIQFIYERPLFLEDHDVNRPVGLAKSAELMEHEQGYWMVLGEIYITDRDHWVNREKYKGFSLGVNENVKG